MFSHDAPSPSFVETPTTTGHPTRKRLFAASVTGVSEMPAASRASVAPVQGAITSALTSFLGPSGSTACNVSNTAWPVRASSRSCQNCPVPKRVSCFAAKLMMGSSSQPCSVSCCAAASAASSVQKLPHTANAMRPFFCVLMCVPPAPAKWSARCVPPLPRPCPAHRRRAG